MIWLPLIYAGSKIIEGVTNWWGAKSAAETQAQAAREAQGQIEGYYNKAKGYQDPYYQQGTKAYQRLGDLIGRGAYDMPAEEFKQQDFNFEADPGYQFRLGEGQRDIEASASAKGSLLSGATLKALSRYNQGFASQEYANAFNRYGTNRTFAYNNFIDSYNRRSNEMGNQYNRLAGMANTGIGAGQTLSSLATGAGEQVAGIIGQRGNAQAAGQMGQANALGSIAGNIGNAALGYGMMQMQPTQTLGSLNGGYTSLGNLNGGYTPQYDDNVGFGSGQNYYLGR